MPTSPHRDDFPRQLDALRRGLHDLATEQRRLQLQHNRLMDSVEALLAGRSPRVSTSPPTLETPFSPSLWQRLAKGLLRRLMNTVRRLWQLGAVHEESFSTTVVATPALELPTLALVLLDPSPRLVDETRNALALQSIAVELLFWHCADGVCQVAGSAEESAHSFTARDPGAVRQQIQAEYVATLTSATLLQQLPSTTLELLCWALAAEDLAWLELSTDLGEEACHQGGRLRLVRRRLWHPGEEGFEASALESSEQWLGKVIHFPRGTSGLPPADLARTLFHPLAKGYHRYRRRPQARGRGPQTRGRGPQTHSLRPLHLLPTAKTTVKNTADPTTLILVRAPLVAGVEQWLADVLRAEGLGGSCSIACHHPSFRLQAERLLALETLAQRVYPLADLLPEELLDSALAALLRREGATRVIHLGENSLAETSKEILPPAVDCREFLVGAVGDVSCGIDLQVYHAANLDPDQRIRWRQRMAVSEEQILVTQVTDLVAEQRPEDFVTLAHQLRDDPRFVFLLVGRGPRAAQVDDLLRYLAPPRFHRFDSAPWLELLAASEVVVSSAERQPLPYFLLAALACQLPVVAAKAPGMEDLLAEGPCGEVVEVGDHAAMARALVACDTNEARSRLGHAGRTVVEQHFSLAAFHISLRRRLLGRGLES